MRGQEYTEGGSLSKRALHFNSPAMRFHDHFALKHADADASFLGGLKWAEERPFQKFRTYAAAIILNREDIPGLVLLGVDGYFTAAGDCFPGIQQEV
jgi:hypothetical protein